MALKLRLFLCFLGLHLWEQSDRTRACRDCRAKQVRVGHFGDVRDGYWADAP